MRPSRRNPMDDQIADDYPIRPRSEEEQEPIIPKVVKLKIRTIILLFSVYFIYGLGSSMYGPLYPKQARKSGLNSYIYGAVIATSHFVCILVYPVSCRMVATVSYRLSFSVSILMIGVCRILFGSLALISEKLQFIGLSFAIQAVEGIGISILVASTIVIGCSQGKDESSKISLAIQIALSSGLAVGPIVGKSVQEALGFDISFYTIGALTLLAFIFAAVLLLEPDQRIPYEDIPIIFWTKEKRMIVYFLIVFATFNYVGFLSVCLEHYLKQFHLKNIYFALLFSMPAFVYGLTEFGWKWLIKKGFNSVLLIMIGSLLVLGSLILNGPAPSTTIKASLVNVSLALLLAGVGIACKSACVIESSEKDLRNLKKFNEVQMQLIVPTMFSMGVLAGYFTGSLTAGFTDFYVGYKNATIVLLGLEVSIAVTSVILAFKRNYISDRFRTTREEREQILRT